ncbi:protein DpdH [Vibrio renipiscarius]|uniref:protein DpdH n=1 Tax=Vibrio renipiscarius TaxID=1461322 RepID=UPI00354F35D2
MSIQHYWPTLNQIDACIHSEAEELSDALLLAVHNPMQLVSSTFSNTQPELKTEQDVLEHLLVTNRPIPIVGESGGGKSHLIRWLHAQLKFHPTAKQENWHMVRIPKNATMRQVLTLILGDLQGEVFDSARKKIEDVGTKLSDELMQDIFFTFLCEALRNNALDCRDKAKRAQQNQDREALSLLKIQATFTKHLSTCFADPVFQQAFSAEDKPIANTIDRLIKSKSYAEVEEKNYAVTCDDFNFLTSYEFEFSDFNLLTKQAIEGLQLTSSDSKIAMAVEMTNQAVNATTKLIFNHLFQFSNGNFQDLFVEIRTALKADNRVLVILVEDLAAISAIDDVLIDSLLQEDTYDGVQTLCPLKSVIATTDSNPTYFARRETILTRSGFEWRIPNDNDLRMVNVDAQPDIEQVMAFCARYLNAARHGIEAIEAHFADNDDLTVLPVWLSDAAIEQHEKQALDDFGYCSLISGKGESQKIALFPFNATAIRKLAELKLYRKNGQGEFNRTRFNPRAVIKEILIPILRDNHADFVSEKYPSANFARQHLDLANDSLREWVLREVDKSHNERVMGFVAVYGEGDTLLAQRGCLTNRQAEVFHLPTVFGEEKTQPVKKVVPSTSTTAPTSKSTNSASLNRASTTSGYGIEKSPTVEPLCSACMQSASQCQCVSLPVAEKDPCASLEEEVNAWFAEKRRLSADVANDLRKHLFHLLESAPGLTRHSVESAAKWTAWSKLNDSKSSLFQVVLKSAQRYRIAVPKAMAEDQKPVLHFCLASEVNNSNESFALKQQALAILRYAYYQKKGQGWDYPQGFEDYTRYMDFVQRWVPQAIQVCVDYVRLDAPLILARQWDIARALGLKPEHKMPKCMDLFVQEAEHIRDRLVTPINDDFAQLQEELLIAWTQTRAEMLKRLACKQKTGDPVAIELSAFQVAFKAMKAHQGELFNASQRQLVKNALDHVSPKLKQLASFTLECEKSDELRESLDTLREVYKSLPREVCSDAWGQLDARSMTVEALQKTYKWDLITHARKFEQSTDQVEQIELLYQIDGDNLNLWCQVLDEWLEVSKYSLPRLEKLNQARGSDQLEQLEQAVDLRLAEMSDNLSYLQEQAAEQSMSALVANDALEVDVENEEPAQ